MRRLVRWLAMSASVGMFLVLVMGATVTNTGSAEGCGRSWPLCNGRFVPEFTVATAIEFSHRAVTGVEGVLVVAPSLAGPAGVAFAHRLAALGAVGVLGWLAVWTRRRAPSLAAGALVTFGLCV